MTDGEMSRASSFKLSSFQSISSPIDEGVEDSLDMRFPRANDEQISQNSNRETSCSSYSHLQGAMNLSDVPKLMVNDDNYVFTSSPKQKLDICDYFPHKNRVSSFEELSLNSGLPRDACLMQSRSLEQEERRIDTAFSPINLLSMCTKNEKVNPDLIDRKTSEKRSTMWTNSIITKNETRIKESNECEVKDIDKVRIVQKDTNTSNEEFENVKYLDAIQDEASSSDLIQHQRLRISFDLSKFKQNAIESINIDTSSESSANECVKLSSSFHENDESNILNSTTTSTSNEGCYSDEESLSSSLTESLLETPSIDDVRKFVKSFDSEDKSNGSTVSGELAPLLGIEMQSMSSSTDPE